MSHPLTQYLRQRQTHHRFPSLLVAVIHGSDYSGSSGRRRNRRPLLPFYYRDLDLLTLTFPLRACLGALERPRLHRHHGPH